MLYLYQQVCKSVLALLYTHAIAMGRRDLRTEDEAVVLHIPQVLPRTVTAASHIFEIYWSVLALDHIVQWTV